MFGHLAHEDFPLYAVGPLIYSPRWSSPICTAISDDVATAMVVRLNRDHFAAMGAPGFNESGARTELVFGKI